MASIPVDCRGEVALFRRLPTALGRCRVQGSCVVSRPAQKLYEATVHGQVTLQLGTGRLAATSRLAATGSARPGFPWPSSSSGSWTILQIVDKNWVVRGSEARLALHAARFFGLPHAAGDGRSADSRPPPARSRRRTHTQQHADQQAPDLAQVCRDPDALLGTPLVHDVGPT